MKTVTNYNAGALIAERTEFRNHGGYFSGREHRPARRDDGGKTLSSGSWVHPGWLPKPFDDYARHDTYHYADYIVFSFDTPIGWHVPDHGWVVPEVTYSQRTNRHQSILRSAVWEKIVLRPSWSVIGESSPTAVDILRSIRVGYSVDVSHRRRRIIDLILATGEAVLKGDDLIPV